MLHFSSCLLIICGLGLAVCSPAERRSYASVECRTEYTTVWETEYEERQVHDCVTKWVPECHMKFEKQCKPTYREVVNKSKNLFHSLTPFSFSARPSIRKGLQEGLQEGL